MSRRSNSCDNSVNRSRFSESPSLTVRRHVQTEPVFSQNPRARRADSPRARRDQYESSAIRSIAEKIKRNGATLHRCAHHGAFCTNCRSTASRSDGVVHQPGIAWAAALLRRPSVRAASHHNCRRGSVFLTCSDNSADVALIYRTNAHGPCGRAAS